MASTGSEVTGCSPGVPRGTRRITWAAAAGALGALGACASCCLLPFALAGVGLGGAWLSGFTALQPYKPFFLVLAAGLLVLAFHAVYRKKQALCSAGAPCATCGVARRRAKRVLWSATFIAVASIVFDYFEPLIFASGPRRSNGIKSPCAFSPHR